LASKKILQNGKNANEDTGKIVEVNEQAAALTGYREATLREMSVSELVPPGQSDDYSELFFQPDQVSTDTLPDGTPLRFKRADGSTVPIDMVSNYVEIDDQQYRLGIVRDITDRRERIRELERKRDFLQQIQEAVNLGGWEGILDSELNVWSEEAYRILGLPQDTEPTAEAAIECFHPEDRPSNPRSTNSLLTERHTTCDSDWHLLRTVLPVGCALSASHSTTKILANSSLFAV